MSKMSVQMLDKSLTIPLQLVYLLDGKWLTAFDSDVHKSQFPVQGCNAEVISQLETGLGDAWWVYL